MKQVLCMGGLTMDLMMRLPHFPAPGETVVTDQFSTNPGGKGSNQAATIAKLGGKVRYFTKLGGDHYSAVLTTLFADKGIDMSRVIYDPSLCAGVAMVEVDASGQNACAFCPGASLALTAEEVEANADVFDGCDLLLITMELRREAVYAALRIAKSRGMTIVMDPSPMPESGIPKQIAEMVDFVKPNETETEMLTGVKVDSVQSAFTALCQLEKLGFQTPIVSLGEKGCVLRLNGQPSHVPPVRVNARDTTAAGDVFIGGFVFSLLAGKSINECVRFASRAAALSATRLGAQSSIPSLNEVLNCKEGA